MKKKHSLIVELSIIFAAFSVVVLVSTFIATYHTQVKTFNELSIERIKQTDERLNALIMQEGDSFLEFRDYYLLHMQEMVIEPIDFDEYISAREEFYAAFAKEYPGKGFGSDIKPSEMTDELQNLYYVYLMKYWFLTFEDTRDSFDLSFCYFLACNESDGSAYYMIEGAREPSEDNAGAMNIDYLADYSGDEYKLLWRVYDGGEVLDEVKEWDNEYGHTYSYFYPLIINGEKVGIISAEVDVDRINKEALLHAIDLGIRISGIITLLEILMLFVIYRFHVSRLIFLTKNISEYGITRDKNIIDEINGHKFGKDEVSILAEETATMMTELKAHEAKIRKAAKMKSDFLANMSHEMRTPMNAVIGMADLALREKTMESAGKYIAQIKTSGKLLLNVIDDILDYQMIDSGKMEVVATDYDPMQIFSEISESVKLRIADKNVVYSLNVSDDMPKMLCGDGVKVRQILINIVNNAIKFTNEGSITVNACAQKTGEDSILLKVAVKDTGVGIEEENLKSIFESFTQVDASRSRAVDGMGLGLTIAGELVRLMKGKIDVKSNYGEGSEFSFTVPQLIAKADKEELSETSDEKTSDFIAPEAKVLIVDDNAVNLAVAEGLLEPLEMTVVTVSGGRQAIELASRTRFDLIFMDHMMPEVDGIEATHIIREKNPEYKNVPIVALSANALGNAREMFMSEGLDEFVPKPVEVNRLYACVRSFLPPEKIHPLTKEEAAKRAGGGDVPQIGDLDTKTAINMLGSSKIYLDVLKKYYKVMDTKAEVLRNAFDMEDFEIYTIEVHALKSASRQIGAEQLATMAEKLESAGKSGDTDYIKSNHAEMMEKYVSYKSVFEKFFDNGEAKENKEMLSDEVLKDILEKTLEAADNLDMDAMEEVSEILERCAYPEKYADKLSELAAAIENYDLDECANIAEEIRG